MKARKLEDGETLQVDDIIIGEHVLGKRKHVVHRVTKKYAFVRYNETAEGKFPIVYDFGFTSLPRERWRMTRYSAYRPVKEEETTTK
jgi:hypothetical protein